MDVYRDGSIVLATISFLDENGNTVEPVTAAYRVLDELGAELVASTPVAITPGETSATITIASGINVLGDATRVMRVVELTMTNAAGVKSRNHYRYLIESTSVLVVAQNSYQTYDHALLIAEDIPSLAAWEAASERDRKAALVDAHQRIGKLAFSIRYPDWQDRLYLSESDEINDINGLTADELRALESRFLQALYRAQIVEADHMLGGNPADDRRREGLMSESIGESSMMFRPGKPVVMPVCQRALRYLSGYVKFSAKFART